ncbi:hypothetical protein [Ciceribacter azotifigens]|uniref:hypothetical protein n=1 Tax=Ciceribacter azotifigens TaxID=2069303 RepID=UPI003A84EC3A
MPTLKEVKLYLTGLWLLFQRDTKGFRFLDLTDRGALRSFWAMAWAGPAILVSWLWWRAAYLAVMPLGTETGPVFFFRLALVEVANWLVPVILAGMLAWALGIGPRFAAIVTVTNWLALPVSYAYAVLILLMVLLPALKGLLTILWLGLLLTLVFALFRILRMILGDHTLTVATMTMVLLVPTMLLSELLERFLGVFPG